MNTNYTMKRWQLAYHCNSDSSTPPLCEMMGTYQLSRWTGDQTVCTIQTIDLSLPWSNSNRDTIYKNGIRYLIKNGISQKKRHVQWYLYTFNLHLIPTGSAKCFAYSSSVYWTMSMDCKTSNTPTVMGKRSRYLFSQFTVTKMKMIFWYLVILGKGIVTRRWHAIYNSNLWIKKPR